MDFRMVLSFVGPFTSPGRGGVELNNWRWDTSRLYQIGPGALYSSEGIHAWRGEEESTTVKNKLGVPNPIHRHRHRPSIRVRGAAARREREEKRFDRETAMMRPDRAPREHSHASDLCPIFLFNRSPAGACPPKVHRALCCAATREGNQRPPAQPVPMPLPCIAQCSLPLRRDHAIE